MYFKKRKLTVGQTVRVKLDTNFRNSKSLERYTKIDNTLGTVVSTGFDTVGVSIPNISNYASKNGTWWVSDEELSVVSSDEINMMENDVTDRVLKVTNYINTSIKDLTPGTKLKIIFTSEMIDENPQYENLNGNTCILSSNNRSGGFTLQFAYRLYDAKERDIESYKVVVLPMNMFNKGDVVSISNNKTYVIKSIKYDEKIGYTYYLEFSSRSKNDGTTNRWYPESKLKRTGSENNGEVANMNILVDTYSEFDFLEPFNTLSYTSTAKIIKGEEHMEEVNLFKEVKERAMDIVNSCKEYKKNELKLKLEKDIEDVKKSSKVKELIDKHNDEINKEMEEILGDSFHNDLTPLDMIHEIFSSLGKYKIEYRNFLTNEENEKIKELQELFYNNGVEINATFKRLKDSLQLLTTPEQVQEFLKSQNLTDNDGLIIDPKDYWANKK